MLQKKQHLLSAKRRVLVEPPDADGKPRTKTAYWRQPLWLMGIGLMLVGAIMSFAVFALLGQAVGTHTTYQYLLLEGGTDSHSALKLAVRCCSVLVPWPQSPSCGIPCWRGLAWGK